jgi:hypothetical protein
MGSSKKVANYKLMVVQISAYAIVILNEFIDRMIYLAPKTPVGVYATFGYLLVFTTFSAQLCLAFVVNSIRISSEVRKRKKSEILEKAQNFKESITFDMLL